MIGRIVSFGPGDEIDQRLLITKVTLSPIGDRVLGLGGHPLGYTEELGRLPIFIARVIARTAIGEGDNLHIRAGACLCQFRFDVTDNIIFQIIIP